MKYINTFQVLLLISTSIAVPVSLSNSGDTIGAIAPIPDFNTTESQSGNSDYELPSDDSVDTTTVGDTRGDVQWSGLKGHTQFNGTLPHLAMGPGPVVFPKGINGGTDSEDKFVKSALELIQQLNSTINNMAKSLSSKSKVSTHTSTGTPTSTGLPSLDDTEFFATDLPSLSAAKSSGSSTATSTGKASQGMLGVVGGMNLGSINGVSLGATEDLSEA